MAVEVHMNESRKLILFENNHFGQSSNFKRVQKNRS